MAAFDFDLTDVDTHVAARLAQYKWLQRQCRRLLEQRSRAFKLGYKTGREERMKPDDDEDDEAAADVEPGSFEYEPDEGDFDSYSETCDEDDLEPDRPSLFDEPDFLDDPDDDSDDEDEE